METLRIKGHPFKTVKLLINYILFYLCRQKLCSSIESKISNKDYYSLRNTEKIGS
jgi:hypothetical protein